MSVSIETNAKSRGRPRKSVLSVCEEPSGVDVLLDLRRELDDQGTSSPEPPIACDMVAKGSDKAEEKARVKAEKAAAKLAAKEEAKLEAKAAKEALKAEKAAAKLAAKEEAKAAREEAKLEAKALKLAEREAKKEAKKLEREAAREAKKAAKKVSKDVAVDKSEPNVAEEAELVVEAYESEGDMVCDGAKNEVEMLRQPSTGYEAPSSTETTCAFYDSWCDP